MLVTSLLKTQVKLKELEITYQNPIYICISWCSKICWFPVKKCWCQQNSRDVSHDLYIFWFFLREGITVPIFIIVGHLWHFRERGPSYQLGVESFFCWMGVLYPITCHAYDYCFKKKKKKRTIWNAFCTKISVNSCLLFLWPLIKYHKLFMHYYYVAIKVRFNNKTLLK